MIPDSCECVVDRIVVIEIVRTNGAVESGATDGDPIDSKTCMVSMGNVPVEPAVVLDIRVRRWIHGREVRNVGNIRQSTANAGIVRSRPCEVLRS